MSAKPDKKSSSSP
nr:hypothetical protein [Tanacetum cinerariifolium]